MKFALILAVFLSLAMAFFAVQNSQHTQVTFMGWYYDAPLVIVLLLAFGVGALSAFLAILPGSLRKSMEISKLKSMSARNLSKLEGLEKQLKIKESELKKAERHEFKPENQ